MTNKLKKAMLMLGLGLGMSATIIPNASAVNCRALWIDCDWNGNYQACVDYTRWCGDLP